MITKLVFCVRKRADLSVEEFQQYWLHQHGPLVRSLWESGAFPGMVKYVQSHTISGADGGRQARGTKPPYDGITEVWMDTERGATDEATRAASAAAGKRLLEDESTFIDFADSCILVTTEHVIFE